jgi:DNA-binding NarL/FixJ family response regulator
MTKSQISSQPLAIVAHVQPLTRQAIYQALEGRVVVWDALSIAHALGLARQVPPDVLFVGDILPDGTPAELIRQLRQTQAHLVVVQLTEGTVDHYLPEPVVGTQVKDMVVAALHLPGEPT